MVNQLHGRPMISHMLIIMLFYSLYYTIGFTSLKITQAFHLLLAFAENPIISWYFKIQNSNPITKSSDNGDSDN